MATAELTPTPRVMTREDEAARLAQLQQLMSDQSQEITRLNTRRSDVASKKQITDRRTHDLELRLADTTGDSDSATIHELEKTIKESSVLAAKLRGLDALIAAAQRRLDEVTPELSRLSKIASRRRLESEIATLTSELSERDAKILKVERELVELHDARQKVFEKRLALQHSLEPQTPAPGR